MVVLVVLMALFMFWGSEQLERIFGKRDLKREPKLRYAGAGVLAIGAFAVMLIGQPTNADRWARLARKRRSCSRTGPSRSIQVSCFASMHDHKLKLVLLDVRSEADYNLFHLHDAVSG